VYAGAQESCPVKAESLFLLAGFAEKGKITVTHAFTLDPYQSDAWEKWLRTIKITAVKE
jgi:hypothetical protein